MPKKGIGCSIPRKMRIYKMFKIAVATRKKKRGKGVRPAAIVIFETETGSCDHVFRLLCFCYGSNSVVGSFTYIIRRAANQKPIVNACSSCIRFLKLFEQSLLLLCESGSEFCFKPHNGFNQLTFVCSV